MSHIIVVKGVSALMILGAMLWGRFSQGRLVLGEGSDHVQFKKTHDVWIRGIMHPAWRGTRAWWQCFHPWGPARLSSSGSNKCRRSKRGPVHVSGWIPSDETVSSQTHLNPPKRGWTGAGRKQRCGWEGCFPAPLGWWKSPVSAYDCCLCLCTK